MKKYIVILTCLLLASCNSTNRKEGEAMLKQADNERINGNFNGSYIIIDSINNKFLTDTIIRHQAKMLKRQVMLDEAKRNLIFLDSIYPSIETQIQAMSKNFSLVSNKEYETMPNYYAPALLPGRNMHRTYLRVSVDTLGNLITTSVFSGPKGIKHQAIRVSFTDNSAETTTAPVPFDGALNYQYKDGINDSELVTYSQKDALMVASMLNQAANEKKGVRISFLGEDGKAKTTLTLRSNEIRAVSETLALSNLLSKRQEVRTNMAKAQQRINRLSNSLSKQ